MQAGKIVLITTLVLIHFCMQRAIAAEDDGEISYEIKLGLVDETGLDAISGSFKLNFEKVFGKTILALDDAEKLLWKWSPGIDYSYTRLKLKTEEKETRELDLILSSLTLERDGFEPYLRFKLGRQKIDTKFISGEKTQEDNSVFVWCAGVEHEIESDISLTWDYSLTQEQPFADKVHHKSKLSLKFEL